MKPELFGLSTYFLMWGVAVVLGVWSGTRLAQRAGLPARESFLAVCAVAFVIFAGSKLLFLTEHVLFPDDDPMPIGQNSLWKIFWHGFRIPGGILLLAAALPWIGRGFALPTRRFADAIMPAVGVAVAFIRLGCFFNGCCFGGVTHFPLAVTFPPSARVYEWQMMQGLISGPMPRSLPVHPLQLYFAGIGVLMYVLGRRWQNTKHVDGEVWANTYLLFFGATFMLELLRPAPLHLNLILTSTVVAATLIVRTRVRQATAAVAGAHP